MEAVTRKEAPHLSFRHLDGVLPPPVSRADGPHWSLIKQAILETLQPAPEKGPLIVAPYMARRVILEALHLPPCVACCNSSRLSRCCPGHRPACSGMTDSRFYIPLAGGRTYRFAPQRYTAASLDLLHNVDERIEGALGGGSIGAPQRMAGQGGRAEVGAPAAARLAATVA